MSEDSDSGRPLKNIPDNTIISYWDIGIDLGFYDSDDIVYLDMPPTGIANANDIRLTQFGTHMPGSKIAPEDDDINAPLKTLNAEICFLSTRGSRSYSLNDPVYVYQSGHSIASIPLSPSGTPDADKSELLYSPTYSYLNASDLSELADSSTKNIENVNEDAEHGPLPDDFANSTETNGDDTRDSPAKNECYFEQLSYSGSCDELPRTRDCLVYSDGYVWTVSDKRIDRSPIFVGFDNSGYSVEAFRCLNADYYHMLGTLYVKLISKEKTLFIQSAASQDKPGINGAQGSAGEADGSIPYAISTDSPKVSGIIARVLGINDIRLTSSNGLAAGTKIQNFDIDLNMPIASFVLVSFPKRSDDYAGIRVYDANGNGLYDFEDDIYLDISFPGSYSFGTVSINDVRLSATSA